MSLMRSAAIVGLVAALSRVAGFVRDVMIAAALGAGPVADAFLVAFRLPNLVRRTLSEGGFEAGLVPLYTRLRAERGDEAAGRFAGEALMGLVVLVLALVAVVQVAAGGVVLLLAGGYAGDPGTRELAATLIRLAFPFVLGVSAAAFLGALLTAHRRALPAALAPLTVNAGLILVLAALNRIGGLAPETRAMWLAAAVTGSGFVQLAVVAVAARGIPGLGLARPRLSPEVRRLLAHGGPALAASAAAQLMIVAATQVASFTPSAVSWLYYADRLFQLPLGFVGVAVGLVLLPEMAAREAEGDRARFLDAQNRALEAALLLALPAALALGLLAYPIAVVLFQRGAFGPVDSTGTALILAGLSLGLPFAAVGKVLSQSLFARGRARAALATGGFAVLVTAAAAFVLAEIVGVAGIGIGTALGLAAHAVSLGLVLAAEGLWRVDARLRERLGRMAGACLAMGAALFGMRDLLQGLVGSLRQGWIDTLLLGGFCALGLAVYAGAALLFGAVTRADLAALRGRG
ncbi:murein biosynthesis integral membrane protein MurJ [Salinarimonas soli]|uniref:Probable lipid II flippase MurJ n=1 Tax=Salinarimonas soli TaxID=1638099 RepID=A0A5B2VBL7_9HYPH|nr:murein biosynthesis integral membrane protein MurJ [Salinarimonas soli]KAA2236893.1 murein biosynthesis integral membrane protein MurJ [Salinarimonas soli]